MRILGRFYFKQTNQGNLFGEFSNNKNDINLTESANILENYGEIFTGKYKSTWFENNANSLTLEIKFKENTAKSIYSLNWLNNNGTIIYWGEGFTVDNILIGDYRNFES